MNSIITRLREEVYGDFTMTALRIAIITWALVVIVAALFIENKWLLAGILAWEVLP